VIALNNLAALLCERAHQPDQALRWAQKAREAAPDDPTVADTLGWIYFRQGLFASAMPYLKAAGRSNLRVAKYHLALAYLKTGDAENGKRLLNEVLSATPQLREREPALESDVGQPTR
jgi:Tfp pilus assembly protein PilF